MVILEFSELGLPISDYDAESFITELISSGVNDTVSTSNAILAARAMIARGNIQNTDICFMFNGSKLYPDKDGRLAEWPKGFCDFEENWLMQLMKGKS